PPPAPTGGHGIGSAESPPVKGPADAPPEGLSAPPSSRPAPRAPECRGAFGGTVARPESRAGIFMSSILVINASDPETRVALVENGHISEFYLERNKEKGIVGNIYKGKVVRVLPGMQAAFVDIGLDKAA